MHTHRTNSYINVEYTELHYAKLSVSMIFYYGTAGQHCAYLIGGFNPRYKGRYGSQWLVMLQ